MFLSKAVFDRFKLFFQHLDTSEMLIRGMNVVVLHEVTGAVMSSRWFDTYESKEDSGFLMAYLQGLRHGRIICFAIKVGSTIYYTAELVQGEKEHSDWFVYMDC